MPTYSTRLTVVKKTVPEECDEDVVGAEENQTFADVGRRRVPHGWVMWSENIPFIFIIICLFVFLKDGDMCL